MKVPSTTAPSLSDFSEPIPSGSPRDFVFPRPRFLLVNNYEFWKKLFPTFVPHLKIPPPCEVCHFIFFVFAPFFSRNPFTYENSFPGLFAFLGSFFDLFLFLTEHRLVPSLSFFLLS